MKSLTKKNTNILAGDYPELLEYVDAINQSYWLHSKWDFASDINDYKNVLDHKECSLVKNTLLAIAQIEVKVKTFWSKIYDYLPQPEIASVGVTFSESEVRHERAYKALLEHLNLEEEFSKLEEVPQIKDRVTYLNKFLVHDGTIKSFVKALTLFSLFIENASLFGQFAIIKLMNEKRNVLKDIDNIIIDTTKEENLHALFGIHVIKLLREENPELFESTFEEDVRAACLKSYKSELGLLDYIFESGELDYITKKDISSYIQYRLNYSLELLGIKPVFDKPDITNLEFFELEQNTTSHVDFFHKKNPNYTKFSRTINTNDLF